MLNRLLCMLIPFSLLLNDAFAQSNNAQTINLKLEKFRKSYPQEKIHLHLDKAFYSIGDTIYFKAYVVNAEKNLPSAISNIIYLDLIDENNHIQRTLRRPVTDGLAWGTIELTDTLPDGYYRIRSYTNWMRNFDDAYFCDQVITVGNALTSDIITNAVFKFNKLRDKSTDTAIINYKSLHGYPLAGKEVDYSIVMNQKEVKKGKGKTDSKGRLSIGLADIHPQNNQPAELVTHVKIDNKTTVTRVIKLQQPAAQSTIQFFPEGGLMVSGLPIRIGFKAVSGNGLGVNVSGEVTDETSSDTVAFRSAFAGIGSFQFTPQPGHSYRAHLRYEDGTEEKSDLPKAEEYGYVLAVDNTDSENVKINIAAKLVTPSESVIVIAQCNSRIQYTTTLTLNNGNASVVVSKKKFPTGIVQFTVFDAAAQPVAERLVFVNHQDQLKMDMSLDKTSYGKREPVKMVLTVKDNKGNPVTGNFSVAVTDGNSAAGDETNKQSILSNLLLTSDLRGYIEKPDYYFTAINNNKIIELDNLLLTQGWRRFVWKEILADKYPSSKFATEKSLAISGKIVSMKGEPVAEAKVTLISKKGPGYMLDTLTTASGSFNFDELDFEDDKPFVVQAVKGGSSSDLQIQLNDVSPPLVTSNKNFAEAKQAPAPILESYLVNSVHRFDEIKKHRLLQSAHVLKEVVVTTKRLTKIQEAVAPSANLNGPGNADQVITYEDLRNCSELGACLQGKLTGVSFKMVFSERDQVSKLLPFTNTGLGAPMLVIIDGMDQDERDIRNIQPIDVQSIEVLRKGYLAVYGTRAAGGVLIITTKRGGINYAADLNSNSLDNTKSNMLFSTAKGYAVSRKFYSPDYNHPLDNNMMPDLRSTIYWQPNIITNEDGKAVINFYNADNAANYHVIIEGLSENGKPGRALFTYEVK